MSILLFVFLIVFITGIFFFAGIEFRLEPPIYAILLSLGAISLSLIVYLKLKKITTSQIIFTFVGLFFGALSGLLISLPLLILSSELKPIVFLIIFSFSLIGSLFGFKKAQKLNLSDILSLIKRDTIWEDPKVLDTNVLIDGRIADLAEMGFIKGTLLIPRFVIREIQYIADSPDPLRRAKGKRALDILQRIKRADKIKLEIIEKDIPEIKEVDIKLVETTRNVKGTLITNDLNLLKIAQFRGVPTLNLNELAQIMRPPVLPGEVLGLFIVKEGKEHDQGVAYLDDGTMVVVEGGRKYIGKTIEVVIHSVLQTGSGRMIFGKPKSESTVEEAQED